MTTKVDIESLTLADLVSRIERGEEVELERDGTPFARVVACAEAAPNVRGPVVFGAWAGKGWVSDDFDAPMTEEELAEWENRPLLTS